jgi:hypothetical protein
LYAGYLRFQTQSQNMYSTTDWFYTATITRTHLTVALDEHCLSLRLRLKFYWRIQSEPHSKHSILVVTTNELMFFYPYKTRWCALGCLNLVIREVTTRLERVVIITSPEIPDCFLAFWSVILCSLVVMFHRNILTQCSVSSFRNLSYRQVHSVFQSEFSRECYLVLSSSITSILSFPYGHPVAAYIHFLVFP